MKLPFSNYHLEVRLRHSLEKSLRAAVYPVDRSINPEQLREMRLRLHKRLAKRCREKSQP